MEQLMQEYLEYRKILGLSQATLQLDQVCLRKFTKYLTTQQLTPVQVTSAEIKEISGIITVFKPSFYLQTAISIKSVLQILLRPSLYPA